MGYRPVGWLFRLRLRRAAKQYAAKLPRQLQQGWGAADHYAPGQIKTAVSKLGLDANFIGIGYAAFLSEDQFNALRSELPIELSYDEARSAFRSYLPSRPLSGAWDPAQVNSDAFWGSGNPP